MEDKVEKFSEEQVVVLEKKKQDDDTCGEIETHLPGYLGSQDTFHVGNLKGVGRIYKQTFGDTYSKVTFAKLYTTKTPIWLHLRSVVSDSLYALFCVGHAKHENTVRSEHHELWAK